MAVREHITTDTIFHHAITVQNSDGTRTTVDLTELAALDAIAAADLAKIDGITNGTGVASKALVLDVSGNVAMPATGSIGLSRAALAAAGTDATNGGAIATQVVAVTASDGTKGVVLPAAATTTGPILVINTVLTSGANLKVYPVNGGNDNINGEAEDAAFTMGPGAAAWFVPTSATQWYVADKSGVLTTKAEDNILDGVTATAAELNMLAGVTAGTSAASKALTTDAAESLLWTTTDATASETVTLDVEDTRTGAGATGWAIKGGLNANVALGSYANGLYGILNFTGSSGAVTGLGAGACAEIVMGAGTGAGTYAALELEVGMPTGAVSANSGTSLIYGQVYGADISTFDTSGYILNLQGLTAGTSKCFMNVGTQTALADFTKGLRIKVGAVDYVIPLITAAEFAS